MGERRQGGVQWQQKYKAFTNILFAGGILVCKDVCDNRLRSDGDRKKKKTLL